MRFFAIWLLLSNAAYAVTIVPGGSWTGTAGSGYSSRPSDPVRMGPKAACRLLSTPHTVNTGQFQIGVGALDSSGITKVTFYCEGNTVDVTARTIVEGVPGIHAVTVDVPNIATTGRIEVWAVAVPNDGTHQNRVMGPYYFWVDSGNTIAGSSTDPEYFVSSGGSDSNNGTARGTPFLTIAAAINAHKAKNTTGSLGGKITIIASGTYVLSANGTNRTSATRWIKLKPDPAVTVTLQGAGVASLMRPLCEKLWIEGCTFDWSTYSEYLAENGNSLAIVNCEISDPVNGASAIYSGLPRSTLSTMFGAGHWTNGIGCTITVSTVGTNNGLSTVAVGAGGAGYVNGEILGVLSGNAGTVTVTGVTTGAVTSVSVGSAGSGYTASTTNGTIDGGPNIYLDTCNIHDVGSQLSGITLVKNTSFIRGSNDFYDSCHARFHNYSAAWNADTLIAYTPAFHLQYTGGGASASCQKTGANGANTSTFVLTDTINGTSTSPTLNSTYTIASLVTWIKTIPGWNATADWTVNPLNANFCTGNGTASHGTVTFADAKTGSVQVYAGVDIHADYVQDYYGTGGVVENVVDIACKYDQNGQTGYGTSTALTSQGYFLADSVFHDYGVVLADCRVPTVSSSISQFSATCDHVFFDSCTWLQGNSTVAEQIEFRTDAATTKQYVPTNCTFKRCVLPTIFNVLSAGSAISGLTFDNNNVYSGALAGGTNQTTGDPNIDATTFIPNLGSPLIGRVATPYEFPQDRNGVTLSNTTAAIGAYQQTTPVYLARSKQFYVKYPR